MLILCFTKLVLPILSVLFENKLELLHNRSCSFLFCSSVSWSWILLSYRFLTCSGILRTCTKYARLSVGKLDRTVVAWLLCTGGLTVVHRFLRCSGILRTCTSVKMQLFPLLSNSLFPQQSLIELYKRPMGFDYRKQEVFVYNNHHVIHQTSLIPPCPIR